MAPRNSKRQRDGSQTLYLSVALDGDDNVRFRQFMNDQDVGAAQAARMMIASALYDDAKWWAVIRSERRTMAWEFRKSLREEFQKKLAELSRDVADEASLFSDPDPSLRGPSDL